MDNRPVNGVNGQTVDDRPINTRDHRRTGCDTHLQRALRVLQFLSAIISLGLFSARLAKIVRLAGRASHSNGAVEGILCAAVLYTLIATILQVCLRDGAGNILRWILIFFDLLFVGAFIAVADLTNPHDGSSGPCSSKSAAIQAHVGDKYNCRLPWGTFILAIVSTLLHALTAIFHATRHHKRERRQNEKVVDSETQQTY